LRGCVASCVAAGGTPQGWSGALPVSDVVAGQAGQGWGLHQPQPCATGVPGKPSSPLTSSLSKPCHLTPAVQGRCPGGDVGGAGRGRPGGAAGRLAAGARPTAQRGRQALGWVGRRAQRKGCTAPQRKGCTGGRTMRPPWLEHASLAPRLKSGTLLGSCRRAAQEGPRPIPSVWSSIPPSAQRCSCQRRLRFRHAWRGSGEPAQPWIPTAGASCPSMVKYHFLRRALRALPLLRVNGFASSTLMPNLPIQLNYEFECAMAENESIQVWYHCAHWRDLRRGSVIVLHN
jgi:hypothetical protein